MIERIHLQIFREVDRQGSLTAAAERLYLTQSALSHSIRKLEDRLGTPLWRRDGKRLIPTQAGEYMLSLAHRLLPQLEHAEGRLQQFALGERGSLRIGMECHPCYQWLLRQVSPYLARWPDVELDVKQKFQFGGIGALFAFEIDVLVTPDPLYKPGLHYEPVFDYEQVLVVGREHALAQRASVVPGDLADEVLLSYPVPPRATGCFQPVPDPRWCCPPPAQDGGKYGGAAAAGGQRSRCRRHAPLARARVCRSRAHCCRPSGRAGHCQTNPPGHPQCRPGRGLHSGIFGPVEI